MLNDHIQVRGTLRLMDGQPLQYLNSLRDGKFSASTFPPEKLAYPPGKLRFDSFVKQNGGLAPNTLAMTSEDKALYPRCPAGEAIEAFLKKLPPGKYFCKPDDGTCGIGAMRLDLSASGAMIDGKPGDLETVARALSAQSYVIQESLVPAQHPAISRLNPEVLNTVRIVTFETATQVVAIAASLRIGAGVVVDNWAAGGVGVPIDIDTGMLTQFGTVKQGLIVVDKNPWSGEPLRGVLLPHFQDAKALVCKLHALLPANSLGWDIGLLEEGPCVIECNSAWHILFSSQLEPDFVTTFLEFHLPPRSGVAIRVKMTGAFDDGEKARTWLCVVLGTALVNGKIDELSADRLVVTIAGDTACMANALERLAKSASQFKVSDFKASRGPDNLAPGLDVSATFGSAAPEVAAVL